MADKEQGVYVDGRFYPKRPKPTEGELEAFQRGLRRPIYEEVRAIDGYRCDDCEHWFRKMPADPNKPRGWRLRYGCQRCGGKSLSHEQGYYCNQCGGVVPMSDCEEHKEICGG